MSQDSEGGGTSSHTTTRTSSRIEVVGRVSGRRRWTVEQKLSVLRDAFGPGGSVRLACDRHEVGSGLIYTWRRLTMSGELTGMVPPSLPSAGPAFAEVEVAGSVVPAVPQPCAGSFGQIGIELPSGVRVTVDTAVDAEALARVLAVLQR
ncbi:IS66-like element accessory protein TnpA [Rhizorhabdus argentea]|uniref:IS66-like element accessory protein TnpA n=1 Tax=Rhizorhabdus argentea TaxID=1387174 RepID=UPI0030EED42E